MTCLSLKMISNSWRPTKRTYGACKWNSGVCLFILCVVVYCFALVLASETPEKTSHMMSMSSPETQPPPRRRQARPQQAPRGSLAPTTSFETSFFSNERPASLPPVCQVESILQRLDAEWQRCISYFSKKQFRKRISPVTWTTYATELKLPKVSKEELLDGHGHVRLLVAKVVKLELFPTRVQFVIKPFTLNTEILLKCNTRASCETLKSPIDIAKLVFLAPPYSSLSSPAVSNQRSQAQNDVNLQRLSLEFMKWSSPKQHDVPLEALKWFDSTWDSVMAMHSRETAIEQFVTNTDWFFWINPLTPDALVLYFWVPMRRHGFNTLVVNATTVTNTLRDAARSLGNQKVRRFKKSISKKLDSFADFLRLPGGRATRVAARHWMSRRPRLSAPSSRATGQAGPSERRELPSGSSWNSEGYESGEHSTSTAQEITGGQLTASGENAQLSLSPLGSGSSSFSEASDTSVNRRGEKTIDFIRSKDYESVCSASETIFNYVYLAQLFSKTAATVIEGSDSKASLVRTMPSVCNTRDNPNHDRLVRIFHKFLESVDCIPEFSAIMNAVQEHQTFDVTAAYIEPLRLNYIDGLAGSRIVKALYRWNVYFCDSNVRNGRCGAVKCQVAQRRNIDSKLRYHGRVRFRAGTKIIIKMCASSGHTKRVNSLCVKMVRDTIG